MELIALASEASKYRSESLNRTLSSDKVNRLKMLIFKGSQLRASKLFYWKPFLCLKRVSDLRTRWRKSCLGVKLSLAL